MLIDAMMLRAHPHLQLVDAAPTFRRKDNGRFKAARALDCAPQDTAAASRLPGPFAQLLLQRATKIAAPDGPPPPDLGAQLTGRHIIQRRSLASPRAPQR